MPTPTPQQSAGTGKTLTVANKLAGGLAPEFVAHTMTFSARTSANMVQDIIGARQLRACALLLVHYSAPARFSCASAGRPVHPRSPVTHTLAQRLPPPHHRRKDGQAPQGRVWAARRQARRVLRGRPQHAAGALCGGEWGTATRMQSSGAGEASTRCVERPDCQTLLRRARFRSASATLRSRRWSCCASGLTTAAGTSAARRVPSGARTRGGPARPRSRVLARAAGV